MRRSLLLLPLLAALGACTAARVEQPPAQPAAGPGAATVFERRTFKLVKTPDQDLEQALEGMLSASYEAALKKRSGDNPADIGFTYSLAPKGAVYPFSEIEVSCIMQDKYARRSGAALCGDFYADLEERVKKALAGRQ